MAGARTWIQEHQEEALKNFNTLLFKENWDKYAQGNISAWEMEALCFYHHQHELTHVNVLKYGIMNFFDLSTEPIVDKMFKRNGKDIPIFRTYKIIGTVINKNDNRHSISLLTTSGVVNVKFTRDYYAMYARQISGLGEDGIKHVIEKGWFNKGVKLLVTGFRRDDTFVAKSYANTASHQLYKITKVYDNGDIELIHDRAEIGE